MYTFSNRLKIGSLVLMALGVLGMAIGFVSAPSTVEEAKAMVASHGDGHGGDHGTAVADGAAHAGQAHGDETHATDHDEHLLHQLQNRPWAAMYVAIFFFFMISLGVLAFYAIQRAAQAGWSPLLFRVMEGITAWLVPGGIVLFVFLVLSVLHMNHLFVWMDAETVAHDKLLQGKAGYLNPTFFLVRAALFLGGGLGGALGTVLNRLIGRRYADQINRHLEHGGLLLWVRTRDSSHEARATDIMKAHGAQDVHVHELPALESA